MHSGSKYWPCARALPDDGCTTAVGTIGRSRPSREEGIEARLGGGGL